MDKIEAEKRILQTELRFERGELSKKDAIKEMKEIENHVKKSTKMDKQQKKELAHKIIKIILEVLLQIITCGLPALLSGGKTILKHK